MNVEISSSSSPGLLVSVSEIRLPVSGAYPSLTVRCSSSLGSSYVAEVEEMVAVNTTTGPIHSVPLTSSVPAGHRRRHCPTEMLVLVWCFLLLWRS